MSKTKLWANNKHTGALLSAGEYCPSITSTQAVRSVITQSYEKWAGQYFFSLTALRASVHSFLTGHRFMTERMMTVKSESWPASGAACLSLMKKKGRIPAENPDFSGTSALQKNRVSRSQILICFATR